MTADSNAHYDGHVSMTQQLGDWNHWANGQLVILIKHV